MSIRNEMQQRQGRFLWGSWEAHDSRLHGDPRHCLGPEASPGKGKSLRPSVGSAHVLIAGSENK